MGLFVCSILLHSTWLFFHLSHSDNWKICGKSGSQLPHYRLPHEKEANWHVFRHQLETSFRQRGNFIKCVHFHIEYLSVIQVGLFTTSCRRRKDDLIYLSQSAEVLLRHFIRMSVAWQKGDSLPLVNKLLE